MRQIWNLANHMKKWNKEHKTLHFQFFTNKSSILMSFVMFFHVVCKISNFNIWTAKHLAQASFSELTLLQRKASIGYISFEVQQNELENEREKVYIHETILHGAFECANDSWLIIHIVKVEKRYISCLVCFELSCFLEFYYPSLTLVWKWNWQIMLNLHDFTLK